jgi:hypothetical protein
MYLESFRMRNGPLLCLNLFNTTLQIHARSPITLVHTGNEYWCVCEEVVHLLKRALRSFGKEAVEEDCVGKVADLYMISNAPATSCVCDLR